MPNPYGIKYVSVSNGRVVYRPRVDIEELIDIGLPHDKNGFLKPPIKLGKEGDSVDEIMASYLDAKKTLLHKSILDKQLLGYISDQYLKSPKYKENSGRTQEDYAKYAEAILSHSIKINKKPTTLRYLSIKDLSKPLMNKIRDKRLKDRQSKGQDGRVVGNHESGYLKTAIGWGLNHIPELPNIRNPLEKLEKYKTPANTRYVTHVELDIQCREAAYIVDYLPSLIKLSYLLGTRGAETTEIQNSHLLAEGIDVARKKGSKDNIIEWSEDLRIEVDKARSLRGKRKVTAIDPYLITNTRGDKITTSALQSAMGRLKKRMKERGLEEVFFTLHKTKSKAQSDSKNDNISGLSSVMKDRYNTKKHVINTGLKIKE